MHEVAVKSSGSLGDATATSGSGGSSSRKVVHVNDPPLCPKPRRLQPVVPEFLRPLSCTKHSSPITEGTKSGILNNISAEKRNAGTWEIKRCNGCTCYPGSPPRRTENPLVHDAQFLHHHHCQMDQLQNPPYSPSSTKVSHKFEFNAAT